MNFTVKSIQFSGGCMGHVVSERMLKDRGDVILISSVAVSVSNCRIHFSGVEDLPNLDELQDLEWK